MERIQLPDVKQTMAALLRADLKTQLKNRRAIILSCALPLMLLFAFRPLVKYIGAGGILALCMSYGILSIGLMTFPLSFVKDRERNIFQRLRVMPVPSWCIITSRIIIQLLNILLVAVVTTAAGQRMLNATFTPLQWMLAAGGAVLCGAVFLALGQAIAGLIKNPEVVNGTVRMVYGLLIGISAVGEQGVLGKEVQQILKYSPYGVSKAVIAWGYGSHEWTGYIGMCLALSVGYLIIFSLVGFKWFRWVNK